MVKSLAVTDKVDIFVAETNHTPVYHLKNKRKHEKNFFHPDHDAVPGSHELRTRFTQ